MVSDNAPESPLNRADAERAADKRAHALRAVLHNAPRVDKASRDEVLAYAHELMALGVAVLPIRTGTKVPATDNGYKGATTDPAELAKIYTEGMNLGAWLGGSGLIVIDADTPAEVAALASWDSNHRDTTTTRPLPSRPTVSTPGDSAAHHGGGHWWVVVPENIDAAELTGLNLAGAGDSAHAVAMAGPRYVLLPGSVRHDVADPEHNAYVAGGNVLGATTGRQVTAAVRLATLTKATAKTSDHRPEVTTAEATPIDQWAAATPWHELLVPEGWNDTDTVDSCGCPEYTAPGVHSSPKSATAHEGETCEHSRNGGALQIWTTNPPAELAGLERVSKFDFVALTEHEGDRAAAFTALELAPEYEPVGVAMGAAELANVDTDATPEAFTPSGARPRGRVDLAEVLADDYVPPTPTIGQRTDGVGLFYAGKSHSVHGESESGKSLLMQAMAAELVTAGHGVLYLDFEDSAPGVVGRLRAMGTDTGAVLKHFDYWNPEPGNPDPAVPEGIDLMAAGNYTLVVIDGVTMALAEAGLNSNDGDDVARWYKHLPNYLAEVTGAAVVVIDHVPKASNGGRFATGSNQKMGALTGAAYTVDVVAPPAQGKVGTLELMVGKDRGGGVRKLAGQANAHRLALMAEVTVDGTGDTLTVTVDPPSTASAPATDNAKHDPAVLEALDVHLADLGDRAPSRPDLVYILVAALGGDEGLSDAAIRKAWQENMPRYYPGKNSHADTAITRAAKGGKIKRAGRSVKRWIVVPEYRPAPVVAGTVDVLKGIAGGAE